MQARELNETPVLPLRSLQFSDRKRPITMYSIILKLTGPLGEIKLNTVSPDEGEITEGLLMCQEM